MSWFLLITLNYHHFLNYSYYKEVFSECSDAINGLIEKPPRTIEQVAEIFVSYYREAFPECRAAIDEVYSSRRNQE